MLTPGLPDIAPANMTTAQSRTLKNHAACLSSETLLSKYGVDAADSNASNAAGTVHQPDQSKS